MSNKLERGQYFGKVSGRLSTPAAVLLEVTHLHRVDLPVHSHEQAFFSFLLEGSYSESYGRRTFDYSPMTIWWHRPGIVHKDEVGRTGGHFFNVEIQPAFLARVGEAIRIPYDLNTRFDSLVWLTCRLYQEYRNWEPTSELIAEGLTLEMLAYAARFESNRGPRPPAWLNRVVEMLNDEVRRSRTSDEFASEAGVHPVHLARVFRRYYGQTIGEYQQKLRLSAATQLLINRDMPLTEVALAAGFYDQSHFTRVFKRHLGSTPGAFRRAGKKQHSVEVPYEKTPGFTPNGFAVSY